MMDGPVEPNGQDTYTKIPNTFLEEVIPTLGVGELKVMLYVFRRTYGFHRQGDAISLRQMEDGLWSQETQQYVDRGTGLSKRSIIDAVRSLEEKGFIESVRTTVTSRKGKESAGTTIYRLKMAPATPPNGSGTTAPSEPSTLTTPSTMAASSLGQDTPRSVPTAPDEMKIEAGSPGKSTTSGESASPTGSGPTAPDSVQVPSPHVVQEGSPHVVEADSPDVVKQVHSQKKGERKEKERGDGTTLEEGINTKEEERRVATSGEGTTEKVEEVLRLSKLTDLEGLSHHLSTGRYNSLDLLGEAYRYRSYAEGKSSKITLNGYISWLDRALSHPTFNSQGEKGFRPRYRNEDDIDYAIAQHEAELLPLQEAFYRSLDQPMYNTVTATAWHPDSPILHWLTDHGFYDTFPVKPPGWDEHLAREREVCHWNEPPLPEPSRSRPSLTDSGPADPPQSSPSPAPPALSNPGQPSPRLAILGLSKPCRSGPLPKRPHPPAPPQPSPALATPVPAPLHQAEPLRSRTHRSTPAPSVLVQSVPTPSLPSPVLTAPSRAQPPHT